MRRIKMIIEYDGSRYHGFQRQINAHTVQEEIENSIYKLNHEKITLIAASRTDAGVHALGQVIAFDTEASIPPERWKLALNSVLPSDIRALNSEEVSAVFNPRFQAVKKKYAYNIYRKESEAMFYRDYALLNEQELDIDEMKKACELLAGKQNFQAFCARGSSAKTFEREIYRCELINDFPFLRMEIEGNGFLYNMVRIIMGTMLEIGKGKRRADSIPEIIVSRDRAMSGFTAPPQGLYLISVSYPSFTG